jgi:hypothetical protein
MANGNNITGSGLDGFNDKLVGNQFTDGTSQFTLGNFGISKSVTDKENEDFSLGNFSRPITLDTLSEGTDEADNRDALAILKRNYSDKTTINFDVSDVTTFTQYGSLTERFKVAIQEIIKTFPAAITVNKLGADYSIANTATNILFDPFENETNFDVNISRMSNPFAIEFTTTGVLFFSGTTKGVDEIRNMTKEFGEYSVFINGKEHNITDLTPSTTNLTGLLNITAKGKIFSGLTATTSEFQLRPNTYKTEEIFDKMDDIEKFLLNGKSTPKYTAEFKTLRESNYGKLTQTTSTLTWPMVDGWNIVTDDDVFVRYLSKLYEIADTYDKHKTNLISRFLTTGALKEFDTEDQMFEKIIQLYGRSFDEIKKYIDGIAYMTNVTYDSINNVPDTLLKNLAQLLGWGTPNSINEVDIVKALFNRGGSKEFSGVSDNNTPVELDIELYRKILMNTAYLFKSKGTRKSIECLLRLIGAPEGLIEFNEHVYIAGQKINMSKFNAKLESFSGGTYTEEVPVIDSTFVVQPQTQNFPPIYITANTYGTEFVTREVSARREDYPVDDLGYPKLPRFSQDGYFQAGAGWFERTPEHKSNRIVDVAASTFTGNTPIIKTEFAPFTYGEKYLDYMRGFPHMKEGFDLKRTVDNRKSWVESNSRTKDESFKNLQNRVSTLRNRGSKYHSDDEKLVLNVKNVELFLNIGQALEWDVWKKSNKFGCLFGLKSLNAINPLYPSSPVGPDWTNIQIDASTISFFEFADGFWRLLINVKNRQTIDDGHGGGYPTLKMVYLDYLDTQNICNVPDGTYTYETMLEFIDEIGDYWIRLIEQLIPATTIWQGGSKIENAIFHRSKYAYKHEPICDDIECLGSWVECIGPNFNEAIVSAFLASEGSTFSSATWYNQITLNGNVYTGPNYYTSTSGLTDIPTTEMWLDNMVTILSGITGECFNYFVFDDTMTGTPPIDNPRSIIIQGCCVGGVDIWNGHIQGKRRTASFLNETCLNLKVGRVELSRKDADIFAFYDRSSTPWDALLAAKNSLDAFSNDMRLNGWTGKTYHIPSNGKCVGGDPACADSLCENGNRWLAWNAYPWSGQSISINLEAPNIVQNCGLAPLGYSSIGVRRFCDPDNGEFAVLPDSVYSLPPFNSVNGPEGAFPGKTESAIVINIIDEAFPNYYGSNDNDVNVNDPPFGEPADWEKAQGADGCPDSGQQPTLSYVEDFNGFMGVFNNHTYFKSFIYPIVHADMNNVLDFPLHVYGALETGWANKCVYTNWSGDTCYNGYTCVSTGLISDACDGVTGYTTESIILTGWTNLREWSVQTNYTGTTYCYHTGNPAHTCNGQSGFSGITRFLDVTTFVDNPTVQSDSENSTCGSCTAPPGRHGTLSEILRTNPYTTLSGTNATTGYYGAGLKNFGFSARYDLGVSTDCIGLTACTEDTFTNNCYSQCDGQWVESAQNCSGGTFDTSWNWSVDPVTFFQGRFTQHLLSFLKDDINLVLHDYNYCEPTCGQRCVFSAYTAWQKSITYERNSVVTYNGNCYKSLVSDNTVVPTIGAVESYSGSSICGPILLTGYTQTWVALDTLPMNFYGGNNFIPRGDCESIKEIPEPPQVTGTTFINEPTVFKEVVQSIGGLDCFDSYYETGNSVTDPCACDHIYNTGPGGLLTTYTVDAKVCCPDTSPHSGTTYILSPTAISGGCQTICNPQNFPGNRLCYSGTSAVDENCWKVCTPGMFNDGRIAPPSIISNTTYPWISMSNLPAGSSALGNSVLMTRGSYDPTTTHRLGTTGKITGCKCSTQISKSIVYESMNGLSHLFPEDIKNFKIKGTQYVKNVMKWGSSSLNENGRDKIVFDTIGEVSPCCVGDTIEIINHVYKEKEYLGVRKWIVNVTNMTHIYIYRMAKEKSDRTFMRIPKDFVSFNVKDSTMKDPYIDMVFGMNELQTDIVIELGESKHSDFFGLFRIDGTTAPTFLSNLTYWGNVHNGELMTFLDMENVLTETTLKENYGFGYQLEFNVLCDGIPATSLEVNDTIVSYGGKSTRLYDVPESKPCPTDLDAKRLTLDPTDSDSIEEGSLISNVKSSSLTQTYGEGGLVIWDYDLFWKRYYPYVDSNNYEITGGKIYAVLNNPVYKTDIQIPYNLSALNIKLESKSDNVNDGIANKLNRTYLTYDDSSNYPKTKLSWLSTIINTWPSNTIQLFFRNKDVMDGFSYSLRSKQIGNVETLPLYNPLLTNKLTPSTDIVKVPLAANKLNFSLSGVTIETTEPNDSFVSSPVFYKDLQDWVERTIGSNPFSNTYANYDTYGQFHYFEIRSEDSTPINAIDGLQRRTPLKNLNTEFLATTYGDWEVYKNSYPSTSALTAVYNSYTDYSAYNDLTTDVVFDLSYIYSAYTGTTVIPMSGKDIEGTTLQGTNNNTIGPAVKPQILSTNGGPLVVTSASTDYMHYVVKESGSYRFQYQGILTFDYYDTGWCDYLKTNYKDNVNNTYPDNDFDYKTLVNSSILYAGGGTNITTTEGYDANQKTNIAPYFMVTPIYGFSAGEGIRNFKCEVFIERTTISGVTTILDNYVIGNNEEKYPDADDVLIMSVTPADELSNTTLIKGDECGDGSGFIFNKVSNIVLDTKCITLNKGDKIRVKNTIVIDSTSKYGGNVWVNANLGSGVEDGIIKKPWIRCINEACSKPKKMYDLIWDVDQVASENIWWDNNVQYKGVEKGTLYVTTRYEGKKLIVPPTINNLEDLSRLTYLDVSKKYKGPFDLHISKGKTANWNDKIIKGEFTNVVQPFKKSPFTWDGLTTTWTMPRIVVNEGQTPNFPNYAHTYLVETHFRVKGTDRSFTHTVYYDDDVNTTMNQFDKTIPFSDSAAPLTSREVVSENRDQVDRKMYFEGTRLIIDGKGTNIKSNEYNIHQTVKEIVENSFFCECRTDMYSKVVASTNLDCDSGDCKNKCQNFCNTVRSSKKLIGKLSNNDINKKTPRDSKGKFRY